MTSLAQQLQRLAVPYTQSVLSEDKRRVSLLFDPKEAANLDRETVFALGASGLEELETLDEEFGIYNESLFNQTAQNWERNLQSKEVNEQLDKKIAEFLIRLSPYFLLKSAHKALEWLIYRYHIHQSNVDEVLLGILPYHDTNIFVRVVQLLAIDAKTNKWNWMKPAATGGVPLTRSVIVNHCIKDPGFLNFLCDLLPKYIKVHGADSTHLRTVVAFHTCTLLGVLQHQENVNEKLVGILVPRMVRGLRSKCLDHKAGTYMILAQLAKQQPLQQEFLAKLLSVLTKHISPRLSREAICCLTIVLRTQKTSQLTKKSFKHLCRVPALVSLLDALSNSYNLRPLVAALLDRLIPAGVNTVMEGMSSSSNDEDSELSPQKPDYRALLSGLLHDVKLDNDLAESSCRSLLTEMIALKRKTGMADDSTWHEASREFLPVMESRYTNCFDAAIETLFNDLDKHDAADLQEVVSVTMGGVKHQLIGDQATSLVMGLNHPQASVRLLAVRQMVSNLKDGKPLPNNFVETLLLPRLQDDSAQVVLEVVKMETFLCGIIETNVLVSSLFRLLDGNFRKKAWKEVTEHVVKTLCDESLVSTHKGIVTDLLPYLLLVNSFDAVVPLVVLQSNWVPKNGLLGTTSKSWLAVHSSMPKLEQKDESQFVATLNGTLVRGLAASIGRVNSGAALNELLQTWTSKAKTDVRFAVFVLSCLTEVMSCDISGNFLISVLNTCLDVLQATKTAKVKTCAVEKVDTLLRNWLIAITEKKLLPGQLSQMTLAKVVDCVSKVTVSFKGKKWLTEDEEGVIALMKIMDILVVRVCGDGKKAASNALLQKLTMEVLSCEEVSRVCVVIWRSNKVSPTLHVASLYFLANRWRATERAAVLQQLNEGVFSGLLYCLQFDHVSVREGALCCLKTVKEICGKELGPASAMLRKLVKHREEILADRMHVAVTLGNVFNKDGETGQKNLLNDLTDPNTPLEIKLTLLQAFAETDYKTVLDPVVKVGLDMMTHLAENDSVKLRVSVMERVLGRFDANSAAELTSESPGFNLALECLSPDLKHASVTDTMVQQIDKEFFQGLPSVECRRKIVSFLLDLIEKSKCSDLVSQAAKVLRKVKLESEDVVLELRATGDVGASPPATVKGRRRTRQVAGQVPQISWKRVSLVLEALQPRKTFQNPEAIMQLLFDVLQKLLKEEGDLIEYCKKLVLSSLHNITSKWMPGESQPNQESFNLEALVQCIRNSSNLQTQQQALLVMASVAHFFPEYILHNVISVFTFLGSGLLQQDDSHSLQVITYTIETVISALLKAQEVKSDQESTERTISNILQVFVDARHAVPRHRCLLVFRCLTHNLSAHRYLWLMLTLLTLSHAQHHAIQEMNVDDAEQMAWGTEDDMEFILTLSEQFNHQVQLTSLTLIMKYLTTMHELQSDAAAKSQPKKKKTDHSVVDVSKLPPTELRMFQFQLTKLVASVLARETFVTQVVTQLETSQAAKKSRCEEGFKVFLKSALEYMTRVSRAQGDQSQRVTIKFNKALLSKTYEVFDKVNYLLSTDVMLHLVGHLVEDPVMSTRRKALDLLSGKLQQLQPQRLTHSEVEGLLRVTDLLISKMTDYVPNPDDFEQTSFTQLTLFCLKLMCKLLAQDNPRAFLKLYGIVGNLVKEQQMAAPVLSSSLLCIAELCSTMGAHSIPHLHVVVPPVIALMSHTKLMMKQELLLTCGMTALQKVMTNLPNFVSPYLGSIVNLTCTLGHELQIEDASRKSQTVQRLRTVTHQTATVIPPRVLLPVLSQCFQDLVASNQMALGSLMILVKLHLESMKKDDLASQNSLIFALVCQALNLRNNQLTLDEDQVKKIENTTIEAILGMVVRLTETTFRPLFYKLYDWACREESEEGPNRTLTFFHLANRLAERLKGLFNLFVRHTIQAACKLMDKNNTALGEVTYFGTGEDAAVKSCQLLSHIHGMVKECMVYDNEGLFGKEIFNMLHRPLIDQIENFIGGDSAFEGRIVSSVAPCISQLAVASHDDTAGKTLNYQVLLKARHSSPKVRFATIQVVEAMVQKMGEDYMIIVPETIPFLAELMEDDSEEVEMQCRKVIANMEDVLGESLQSYF